MSDSLATPWTVATRLLCPWDFPGKTTGVGCHFLLWGIFLTQGSNSPFLLWQVDSLPVSHKRSLWECYLVLNSPCDGKRRGKQRMRWLGSITDSMDMNLSKLSKDRGAWHAAVHEVTKSSWLSNWTVTTHRSFLRNMKTSQTSKQRPRWCAKRKSRIWEPYPRIRTSPSSRRFSSP